MALEDELVRKSHQKSVCLNSCVLAAAAAAAAAAAVPPAAAATATEELTATAVATAEKDTMPDGETPWPWRTN